ncbi:MAG: hypothetical protein ACXWD7_01390, partial [Solirubrobacterales bacterium]
TMAGGPPDFTDGLMYQTLNADAAGGAVCYENSDCFSWGGAGFTGDAMLPSTAGTPASGLSNSQVLARNITPNCATLLEDADDTNSSAADFNFVIGFPLRNNSVAPTETACPLPMTPVAVTATTTRKKKCKKKKKRSAVVAKKKHCKKKKKK